MQNNTIEKRILPLSPRDKKVIRKVMVSRSLVFFLMILPLIIFSIYINYLALGSFFDHSFDKWSVIVSLVTAILYSIGYYHIYPFYRNIFVYPRVKVKEVISSTVVRVDQKYSALAGIRFQIETTAGNIDTSRDLVLFSEVSFLELKIGMPLFIHKIPGTQKEYLRLGKKDE